jgi:hypothetical protein
MVFASGLEFALRVIQSAALAIHAVLDMLDPLCGAKSALLRIEDALPRWFLPAVGFFRAIAAVANMADTRPMLNLIQHGDGQGELIGGLLTSPDGLVLAAQGYIIAVWTGAMFFHLRRRHHPATTLPAGFFVLMGTIVLWLRFESFLLAMAGTAVFAVAGVALGCVFVKPAEADTRGYDQLRQAPD